MTAPISGVLQDRGYSAGDLVGPSVSAGSGSDGCLDLTMELNGSRRKYHILLVGGQLLIDSNTKLDANPDTIGRSASHWGSLHKEVAFMDLMAPPEPQRAPAPPPD